MWKSANLLLKSSRLVAEMTLLGSRFHRGIRDLIHNNTYLDSTIKILKYIGAGTGRR